MPIKNLTERTRMPRIGKIHLGIKVKNKQGVEYPKATDYFVLPEPDALGGELRQQLIDVYGERPKELEIIFPIGDPEIIASQFYRCYQKTRGLVCRGDGMTAKRQVDTDVKTADDALPVMPNPKTENTELREILCAGRECSDYTGKAGCRELMNLQFMLPKISGLGIWQIDSGSINSIRNINGCLELIKSIYGRIDMVLLKLTIEPIKVTPEGGKSKTVHVLNIRSDANMVEASIKSRQSTYELLVGKPEPMSDANIKELWSGEKTEVLDDGEVAERLTPEEIALAQADDSIIEAELVESENNKDPDHLFTPSPEAEVKPNPEPEAKAKAEKSPPPPEEIKEPKSKPDGSDKIKPVGDVTNPDAEIQGTQLHHMSMFVTKAGSNLKEIGKWCHEKGWAIKEFNDLTVGQYLQIIESFNKGNP